MLDILFLVGDILLYVAFPPVVIFTVFYGLRSKWWLAPQSKALLAKSASLMLIAILLISSLIFGSEYDARPFLRIVVFGFFAFSAWWFAIELLKSQHKEAKKDKALLEEYKAALAHEASEKDYTEHEEAKQAEEDEFVKPIPVTIVDKPWYKKIFRK